MLKKLWDIFVEASEFARVYTYWKKAQERAEQEEIVSIPSVWIPGETPSSETITNAGDTYYIVNLDDDADKPN